VYGSQRVPDSKRRAIGAWHHFVEPGTIPRGLQTPIDLYSQRRGAAGRGGAPHRSADRDVTRR